MTTSTRTMKRKGKNEKNPSHKYFRFPSFTLYAVVGTTTSSTKTISFMKIAILIRRFSKVIVSRCRARSELIAQLNSYMPEIFLGS